MNNEKTDLFDLSDIAGVLQKLVDIANSADETAKSMQGKDDAVESAFTALAAVADSTRVALDLCAQFALAQKKLTQMGNALPPEQRDSFFKGIQLGEELFNGPQSDESNEPDKPAGPPDWISVVLKEEG